MNTKIIAISLAVLIAILSLGYLSTLNQDDTEPTQQKETVTKLETSSFDCAREFDRPLVDNFSNLPQQVLKTYDAHLQLAKKKVSLIENNCHETVDQWYQESIFLRDASNQDIIDWVEESRGEDLDRLRLDLTTLQELFDEENKLVQEALKASQESLKKQLSEELGT